MTPTTGAAPRRRGPRFGTRQRGAKAARSKFGNRKTVVDGVTFDSAKEARRSQQLALELRAGNIRDLQRQVAFNITSTNLHSGASKVVAKYFADFTYWRVQRDGDWLYIVEDVKGVKTDVFKLKRKLVEQEHGVEILLT